jgi:hypothetical protein
MLHGDASALCALLAADGLEIVREQQRAFASYLSTRRPPYRPGRQFADSTSPARS